MIETLIHWDKALFLFFNRDIANPFFDVLFPAITNAKFWIIPGIAALLLYFRVEKKRAIPVILLAIATVTITDQLAASVIKPLVHRLRPCNLNALVEGGRFLMGNNMNFSFPSNHAANMFGAATLLTFFYPRRWLWFYLFAAMIGFSRIYVGLHYPFDVIAGAVLGIICGALVFGVYTSVAARYGKRRSAPQQKPGG